MEVLKSRDIVDFKSSVNLIIEEKKLEDSGSREFLPKLASQE